jgi:hypothetical protein
MMTGKILTNSVDNLRPKNVIWWRDMIQEDLLYNLPKDMGYDFNFNKHYQSGFELRILDGIPIEILKDVLDVIILICEHSYIYNNLQDIVMPNTSQIWNNMVYKSMVYGYKAIVTIDEIKYIMKLLNINMHIDKEITEISMEEFYYKILENLFANYYKKNNIVLDCLTKDFIKINRWINFNKMQHIAHIKSLDFVN